MYAHFDLREVPAVLQYRTIIVALTCYQWLNQRRSCFTTFITRNYTWPSWMSILSQTLNQSRSWFRQFHHSAYRRLVKENVYTKLHIPTYISHIVNFLVRDRNKCQFSLKLWIRADLGLDSLIIRRSKDDKKFAQYFTLG